MSELKLPSMVLDKYLELYDLCENRSKDGLLLPRQVASFCKKDVNWLLATIYAGTCPFAFGNNRGVARGNCCIHVLPFFSYMTQGKLFQAVADGRFEEVI